MAEPLLLRGVRLGPDEEPGDVLLEDGHVAGVDEPAGAGRALGGSVGAARVVDLDGRWLLPGLWDEHVHFTQAALVRQRLDVSVATTAAQAAAMVRARVEAGIYPGHLDRALAEGLRTGAALPGGDGLVTVGPLKVLIDGSLNTRTACCAEPYPDGSDVGLTVAPDELLALLRRATAAGFVPAVHAIGDRAVTTALDTFEALGAGGRIEHAQLVADADLPRFASLGVTASVQPEHAMDDRGVADVHWAGRTGRAFALRSLLDAGARLALGSDAPVSPLDPWRDIAAAVGRVRDGLPPWHPEQRIPVAEALTASARGQDRVRAGGRADLVAVDVDPWSAGPERLREMPVALTVLGGRATHDVLGVAGQVADS